ncbi:MAG TPA: peptidyl-prolyl cis-trans isomerase [Terriglobia bacterium]|nr:peptidyl-prolyl cis-trans isomerase [Terriglobia bacterium]
MMRRVREHLCVRRPRLALCAALLAGLGGAPVWAQNASPPTPAAKPAAPSPTAPAGQPAAGRPGAAASNASSPAGVPPDKVVMRVGDTAVTAADIQGVVKTLPQPYQRAVALQGLKQVGDVYALRLALYQKGVAEGLDQTPEFKKQLEMQRLLMLASNEYQKIRASVQVTPDDIDQYYKQHSSEYEVVQVRRIMIRKKVAGQAADAPGLAAAEAKAKAEAIRQALASGQDAAQVADKFKLANVVYFEPKPETVHRGQLPGALDQAAWTLKDGAVSEIQDNPANVLFIQVVKHEQQSEQDVSREIQSRLSEEKFQKALADTKEASKVWLDPDYFAPPKSPTPTAAATPPATEPQPESKKP